MCLHLTVWTEVQDSSPDDKSMSSKLMLKNFFPIHVPVFIFGVKNTGGACRTKIYKQTYEW